jgi:ferredoxin-NADP reductase
LPKTTVPVTPDNPGTVHIVELLQRKWLSENAFEIELTRPTEFDFNPGQTLCFIHESMERYYSLLSTPADPTLALCVYHVPRGSFSPVLADAQIGTRLNITGPHGYFTFNRSKRTPVFVATGTGIAPFVSMGRSGTTDFILLHEVEVAADLYYQDLFRKIASNYVPCLLQTSATKPLPPGAFRGNAAGFIKTNLAPAGYDFYLCGEREMTREVTLLADEHFPGSYVFREVFF